MEEKERDTLEGRVALLEGRNKAGNAVLKNILNILNNTQSSIENLNQRLGNVEASYGNNQTQSIAQDSNENNTLHPIKSKIKEVFAAINRYSNLMIGVGLISYVAFIIYAYFDRKAKKKISKKQNVSFDFD